MRVVLATILGVLIAGGSFAGTSIDISNSAILSNAPDQFTMHNVELPGVDDRYWATFQWNGEKGAWEMAKAGYEFTDMVFFGADCYQQGDVFTATGTTGDPFDAEGDSDERPARRVCLFPFYIDTDEVTQAEFLSRMKYNPAHFSGNHNDNWRKPVENVTWDEAAAYCQSLKKRLPTEAEWEYAARSGGLNTRWSGTNDLNQVGTYGWTYENSDFRTQFVRLKTPNSKGLYDMTGNVWEWVSDWYSSTYYGIDPVVRPYWDPEGPATGDLKVVRGGGWNVLAAEARTTQRLGMDPAEASNAVGFRCARDPEEGKVPCVSCTCVDYVASHPTECAGARTLQFEISWPDTNDVDLHALYDNGAGGTEEIYWNNRSGALSKGTYQSDWNAACGMEDPAVPAANTENSTVSTGEIDWVADFVTERITWVNPPAGTYTLRVCGFQQCRTNNATSQVTAKVISNGAVTQQHTLTQPRWDRTGACTDVFTHTVSP